MWTGNLFRMRGGYGAFYDDDGRLRRAHRVGAEIALDRPLTPEEFALHACDNPPCVRFHPEHVFLGDQATNLADMRSKGRWRGGAERGEARYNAVLNEDLVRIIRQRAVDGEGASAIARDLGFSRSLVSGVIHRRGWKHVA